MAQMYPSQIALTECTVSERVFYEALKNQLPEHVHVFYSVKWYSIVNGVRENSESDFLIFDPNFGFLTIEVKGGQGISREGNQWYLQLPNEKRSLKRSPFEQSEASMRYFHRYYEEQYHQPYNGVYGFACAFPFFLVNESLGTDAPDELILDHKHMEDLPAAINRIFHYWVGKRRGVQFLAQDVSKKFIQMINRNICLSAISGAIIENQRKQLYLLERMQKNMLDFIENFPQAFIAGGAGTGKTWLAIQKAKRLAEEGHKLLFVCYNTELALFLERQLAGYPSIRCYTFHQLIASILKEEFTDIDANSSLSGVFDRIITRSFPKYDAIIVDEGQDFNEEWAIVIKAMLFDENNNHLYVFHDEDQNIFQRNFRNAFMINTPPFLLKENLRNTSAIAQWAKEQTGLAQFVRISGIPGIPPEPQSFQRRADARQRLESLLRQLLTKENLETQSIVVLSDRSIENSILGNHTELGMFKITVNRELINDRTILFRTVQGFKGMEAEVVIYLTHSHRNIPRSVKLDYVGFTRAKFLLFIINTYVDSR